MTFPQKLDRLMARRGFTQERLAEALGGAGSKVSQRAVSGWLTDGSRPRPEAMRSLATVFGVPVEVLDDDKAPLPPSSHYAALENDTAGAVGDHPGSLPAQIHDSEMREHKRRTAERVVKTVTELVDLARSLDPDDRRLKSIHRLLQRGKPRDRPQVHAEILAGILADERREGALHQSSAKAHEGAGG